MSQSSSTKAPAFQMYTGDFLSSPDVILMTAQEVGAYCLLLFTSWQSEKQGYLDNDEDKLRRIARLTPKQWKESREIILKKFIQTEDGAERFNPRIVKEASRLAEYRQQMKANGLQGGRPKKNNQKVSSENQTVVLQKADRNQNESTSSSSSLNTNTSAFALPDWIDREAWNGFEEMRRKIRKPLTDRARTLHLRELETLRDNGHSPSAVLNQSTMNSWLGLFPVKGSGSQFSAGQTNTVSPNRNIDPATSTALPSTRRRQRERTVSPSQHSR
jgi:uncharacterized protein YdaU (DUF1376 family)